LLVCWFVVVCCSLRMCCAIIYYWHVLVAKWLLTGVAVAITLQGCSHELYQTDLTER
jgi:hypothetical protein